MSMAFAMNNIDVQAFVKALDKCQGGVYLVTPENDRFNLKSKLSQLTGIISLIEGGRLVDAKIVCDNADDESMLFRLNLFGETTEE